MRTITKNLKKYRWTYSNKQLTVSDKNGQLVVLDKIGFLSLGRFIFRILDSMRIEEVKRLKFELSGTKQKHRDSIDQIKETFKKKLKEKASDSA
jgi:hypothetical protein